MSSLKGMQNSTDETIELDKMKIKDGIAKEGVYKDDGIQIRQWEGAEETESYTADISIKKVKYIGILNGKFERDGYGYNKFMNGDEYLGNFEKDKRENHGIYLFPETIQNGRSKRELYLGFWKNNKKSNHGIYLWIDEPQNNTSTDNANFDAYIGELDDNKYIKGAFLSKFNDNYYVYFGGFDSLGRKNDDNAFFYSDKSDRFVKGKIVNDVFVNCYICFFNSNNGEIKDFVYSEFDGKDKIKYIKQKEQIDEKTTQTIQNQIINFRNLIINNDYFKSIYQNYKNITNFIKDNLNDAKFLEDKTKFQNLLKLCNSYNEKNAYNDIVKTIK